MDKTNQVKPPGLIVDEILKNQFIQYLLTLLERPDLVPGVKAHIVQAIKAMLLDRIYGEHINSTILKDNVTWERYRMQSHALFIQNQNTVGGYLTAGTSHAGYLSATANNNSKQLEPPE